MIYEFDGMAPTIDPSAYVSASATILGNVTIGQNCYIGPGAILRGDFREAPITIGACTAIEEGVIIHAGGKDGFCHIGERVTVGHGAIIHCSRLGSGVSVGMGAVVSLYAQVGDGTVVAEGSVVKQGQILPPRVVAGGIPARVLRPLEDRDLEVWEKTKDWYVELAGKYAAPGTLRRLD